MKYQCNDYNRTIVFINKITTISKTFENNDGFYFYINGHALDYLFDIGIEFEVLNYKKVKKDFYDDYNYIIKMLEGWYEIRIQSSWFKMCQ